jgi:hypothetical protein
MWYLATDAKTTSSNLSASGLVRDYVALITRIESKGGNGVFLDLDGFGVIKKNQSLPNLRVRILK